ncbi:hypothetical protein [Sphingomonas sp.]|uniref:hypothetical protein n=1 Tax=Sphingomonas sp. TaxID=28214 RepID=UPI0025EC1E53|nr:hypothetical protein [Sphingomonas sp.]
MSKVSEAEWKRRFALFALVRLGGVATVMLGIAVALTGLVRPGGMPALGAVLGLVGVVEAIFLPRLVRKRWERE